MAEKAVTTIEDGLREIVAEHGLCRLDIGFRSYAHGKSYGATAWWNGGHSCAGGTGQTVDEAVAEALREVAVKRNTDAAEMAVAA